jgi:hypothetical protein
LGFAQWQSDRSERCGAGWWFRTHCTDAFGQPHCQQSILVTGGQREADRRGKSSHFELYGQVGCRPIGSHASFQSERSDDFNRVSQWTDGRKHASKSDGGDASARKLDRNDPRHWQSQRTAYQYLDG